jgi:hypothetical protein
MSAWTDNELRRIGDAQELEIAAVRREGTLRDPVPIWVVRAGEDLYVRAASVPSSGWHRVARASGRAHIEAGGVEREVAVEDADPQVLDDVDASYRRKYGRSASIVDRINDDEHRATTLRLLPRNAA